MGCPTRRKLWNRPLAWSHAALLTGLLSLPACGGVEAARSVREVHPGQEALIRELAGDDARRGSELRQLIESASYQQRIVDLMNRPAEKKPWRDYRPIFVTETRIADGLRFWEQHAGVLAEAERRHGVQAAYLVAIIGVETSYGKNVGGFKVLDALVTLGLYYPPRAEYFRGELKRFLTLDELPGVGIDRSTAVGSYAGAMGLGQFMPTSIARFAVDGDADGRIDLWTSMPDIAHSIANYFVGHGWQHGAYVMLPLTPGPAPRIPAGLGLDPTLTLGQVLDFGFTSPTVADRTLPASLLTLEGAEGDEHYAIFPNFRVITRYNRSPLYATAVYQLAMALDVRMRKRRSDAEVRP